MYTIIDTSQVSVDSSLWSDLFMQEFELADKLGSFLTANEILCEVKWQFESQSPESDLGSKTKLQLIF